MGGRWLVRRVPFQLRPFLVTAWQNLHGLVPSKQ